MKPDKQEQQEKASGRQAPGGWQQMNRKQRREWTRKMQAEEISLQVVHPDAAGIDIGNESHYVAVPPSRDSQPVRRFGCTTAELKDMAAWLKQCRIRTVAILDSGVRHSGGGRFGSVSGECPGHEESAWAQERRAGESMADEAAHLRAAAELVSAVAGDSNDEDVLAAAE